MTTPILIHHKNLQFDQPPGPPNSLISETFDHSNFTSNYASISSTGVTHSPLTPNPTPTRTDELDLEKLSLSSSPPCSSCETTYCSVAQEARGKYGSTGNLKERSFVVAVSGPSSVGKSTLAILLKEIFGGENATSFLIHQDSYFHSKPDCPSVSFLSTTTSNETAFMKSTLALTQSLTSSSLYAISSYNSSSSQYHITGPNTDVDASIDFPLFHSDLISLLTSPSTSSYKIRITPALASSSQVYHSNIALVLKKHATLIDEMRKRVANFVNEQAVKNAEARFEGKLIRGDVKNKALEMGEMPTATIFRPRIIFVEGFLLFCPPSSSSPSHTPKMEDSARHINAEEISQQEKRNLEAKLNIQPFYDLKLFLPASKASVKARRFSRWEYVDEADGGGRKAGQLWKSEGYFEYVAWGAYRRSYGWLLDSEESEHKKEGDRNERKDEKGKEMAGVIMRNEKQESGEVEDAVGWAVDVILEKMALVEDRARRELEAAHE